MIPKSFKYKSITPVFNLLYRPLTFKAIMESKIGLCTERGSEISYGEMLTNSPVFLNFSSQPRFLNRWPGLLMVNFFPGWFLWVQWILPSIIQTFSVRSSCLTAWRSLARPWERCSPIMTSLWFSDAFSFFLLRSRSVRTSLRTNFAYPRLGCSPKRPYSVQLVWGTSYSRSMAPTSLLPVQDCSGIKPYNGRQPTGCGLSGFPQNGWLFKRPKIWGPISCSDFIPCLLNYKVWMNVIPIWQT